MTKTTTICLRALATLLVGAAVAAEADLPFRIDPSRPPAANGTTVLLWRFEKPEATDATVGRNHGRLLGTAASTKGRFGAGLRLADPKAVILRDKPTDLHVGGAGGESTSLIVDFWCRVPAQPKGDGCLVQFPALGGVRLDITADRRLRLHRPGAKPMVGAPTVAADTWFHVALLWRSFMQPNRIYDDGSGIELLINGVHAGILYDPDRASAASGSGPYLCLGNTLKRDAAFDGVVDEFRVSRGAAGVYPLIAQSFPGGKAPARSAEHFRDPAALVAALGFDEAAERQRVKPPEHPRILSPVPPIVGTPGRGGGALITDADDLDALELLGDMETQIAREDKGEGAPLQAAAGVRGQALLVRGGPARLDLPKPTTLTTGTLEFWFAPGNWDNLSVATEGTSYAHRTVNVVTLWGRPRAGAGEPAPLVSYAVNRARGAQDVRPEFRKYFERPSLKILPHRWRHVLITWSDRFPHLQRCTADGRWARARFAPAETWQTHQAAYFTLGNGFDTMVDELYLYSYPLEGVERGNARAAAAGAPLRPWAGLDEPRALKSLGEFPIAVPPGSVLNRISGGWRTGWVTGAPDRGAARCFFGFRPEAGEMIVAVAPHAPDAVGRAEVTLSLGADKSVHGQIPAFKDGKGGVVLPTGDLPVGSYRLTGKLFGADGAAQGEFDSVFRRQAFPSVECQLGYAETPPEPFTPVTREDNRVAAVGREYKIGADGNFQALEALGENILAGPIRFEAVAGGQTVTLRGADLRFGETTPVRSGWSATASGAGLVIQSTADFAYDGLAKYELELRPAEGQSRVEHLRLLIPLKGRYAQLFHVLGPNSGLRNPYVAGAVKPGDGLIWDSKSDVPFLTKRRAGSMVSQLWLGGMVRGLVFYANNDRGWAPNNDHPAVSVTREGDVVTMALHFISAPFTLTQPRRISLQLLGTPPKPLPKDHRLWARGHLDTAGKVGGRLTSCDSFAPWVAPCRASTFAYWPPGDDFEFVRLAANRQRHTNHSKYRPGQALMMYHDKNKTPAHPKPMPYYGWSWGSCRYPTSRINHLIWYMDKMIECGYDGVYIDDVFPFGEWNLEPIGTSYVYQREDGARPKHVGSAHSPYRDYLQRLYNVFVARGKRPIITTHMTSTLGWPYHSFATVAFDHEQSARFHAANGTFMDAWPLDYLMTLDIPERSGLVTVPMLKGQYLEGRSDLQVWCAERSFEAVWMLFDHNRSLDRTILEPYYGMDVEVFPFWRNERLVAVTPRLDGKVQEKDLPPKKWWRMEHFRQSIGRQPLRATIYKKDGRCLLIVANFLRRSVGCTATLDLAALGVPADARQRLTVVDVDKGRPPGQADPAVLHLADNFPKTAAGPKIGSKIEGLEGGRKLDDAFDPEAVLAEDEAAAAAVRRERYYEVTVEANRLSFQVPPHNFRAIELRW